jgi:hypothetical protein
VQRVPDRLVDGVDVESQHGAQSGSHRRAEVGNVVDLVLVQADSLDQADLHLVCRRQTADQVVAGHAELLSDRDQRGDVVTGMGVIGRQKRVVIVEFAHCDAVGPRGPLRGIAAVDAEHPGPGARGMSQRLTAGRGDRSPEHRRRADRGVVDDPIDQHRLGLRRHRHRVDGDLRDLVGQVLGDREIVGAAMRPDRVNQAIGLA